jgi:hypothetical protein
MRPPLPETAPDARAAEEATLLLARFGYQVVFRGEGWCECGVFGHGEAWIGRGLTPAEALRDALARLLPGHLGQALWAQALEAARAEAATPPPPSAPAEAPPTEPPGDGGAPPGAAPEPPTAAPAPAAAAAPPAPPPVRVRLEDPHERLHALNVEIDAASDLPLFAPPLMRLQLLAWVATARDLQDRDGTSEVERRVGDLVKRLAALGRAWWPGSVEAMRQHALPGDCAVAPGLPRPKSWFEVAEQANDVLDAPRGALDAYGWADAAACATPPRCPRSRFGDALAILARLLGPDAAPTGTEATARVAGLAADDVKAMRRAAEVLRWLRGTVDAMDWGRAVGLLRWANARLKDVGLTQLLDPLWRPARPWAQLFAADPAAQARAEARRALPPPGDPNALVAWLAAHGRAFEAPDLADTLRAHAADVLAIDIGAAFVGHELGPLRDRLRKVVKRLGGAAPEASLPPKAEEEPERAPEPPADAGPPEPSVVDLARELVSGRRALFVSNREDPGLKQELERGLDLELDWASVDHPRSLDGIAQRIRGGRYGLVLLATGFISHTHDAILVGAARDAGVDLVRAAKGRPVACALAIRRDLGARPAT